MSYKGGLVGLADRRASINENAAEKKTVYVKWESAVVVVAKHGAPYLAVIESLDAKYGFKRKFISSLIWGRKRDMAQAVFEGELEVGTILEARVDASWKNDYKVFYEVTENGLVELGDVSIATKKKVIELLGKKVSE